MRYTWRLILLNVLIGTKMMMATTQPVVPKHFVFCMTQVSLTTQAQLLIQEQIERIQKNTLAHQVLIERAAIHFPIIEDALFRIGVPDDLKYIAIQESGLRGDAVSTSNAVGYWQFKDFTAREVGLRITSQIDERKHLFRASIGAARYFAKNYFRHRNWLYAIIAYYAGGTGAIPYLKDQYVGVDQIELDSTTHWYLIKAIAHKFAYEQALKNINQSQLPWLEPMDCRGEVQVSRLQEKSGNPSEVFSLYNCWILSKNSIDEDKISYFALRTSQAKRRVSDPYAHHYLPELVNWQPKWRSDFQSDQDSNLPIIIIDKIPVATATVEATPPKQINYREIFIEEDPSYGSDYVVLTDQFNLVDISLKYGIKVQRLKEWNEIKPYIHPKAGQLIYLHPPRKCKVRLAGEFETIEDIAAKVGRSAAKLRQLNGLPDEPGLLKPGQKILLRESRPKDEPIQVIVRGKPSKTVKLSTNPTVSEPVSEPLPHINVVAQEEPAPEVETKPRIPLLFDPNRVEQIESFKSSQPLPASTKACNTTPQLPLEKRHVVAPGETYWSIAQRYSITVQRLQTYNRLPATYILRVGDLLSIPSQP
jgi:membrane-bound lytic murein transglycosylase D